MPCRRDARKLPSERISGGDGASPVEDRRHLVEQHVAHFGERLLGRARWRGLPGIEFNRVRLGKATMAHLAERLLEQCETLRACVPRQALEKLIDHDGPELAARRLGGGLVIVHASECGEPAGRCQWNATAAGEHFCMKRECTASERRQVTECYSPPSARRCSASRTPAEGHAVPSVRMRRRARASATACISDRAAYDPSVC
jgi:hypothetical protein